MIMVIKIQFRFDLLLMISLLTKAKLLTNARIINIKYALTGY